MAVETTDHALNVALAKLPLRQARVTQRSRSSSQLGATAAKPKRDTPKEPLQLYEPSVHVL
jgi:hypothetical protein